MVLLESHIVNYQLSMEIILPLIVDDTVCDLFVFVVANQEEVIELRSDMLFEVFYFLGSEQSVIGILIDGEYFSEEGVYILLCVLNGFHSDLKTEFLPLSF